LGWFSIGLGAAELIAPSFIARLIGSRNHRSLIRVYGLRELAAGAGILASREPAGWLWSRVAGDIVDLASLTGLLASQDSDRGKSAFGLASVAVVTILDVMCAQQLTDEARGREGNSARAEASLIVNRSPEECYAFWRNLENLPRFMTHLKSVRITGDRQSHWIADVGRAAVEWDAEMEIDVPNQRIAWRSLPGSDVPNSGAVEFERASGGRGTIVRVQMDYGNLMHALTSAAAAVVGQAPEQMIQKELRRFKQVMETGEVITTEGQSAGGRTGTTWLDAIAR